MTTQIPLSLASSESTHQASINRNLLFHFKKRRRSAIADRTRSLPCPGTEPTLALSQVRRPHGGHRETYGCPDPTPFSTLSRRSRCMNLQLPSPSLGASHHLPPWCALLSPKPATRFQPRLKLSPQPHTNYHHTNPDCPLLKFHSRFPKPFLSLQHHSICINASPPAASFKQLYRTRPARCPPPTCTLKMGRIRYSTSMRRS
jgi:hypothetical protein